MSSLSDILTAAKNIATALGTDSQNYLNVQGAQNLTAITAATLVKTGAGRICTVIVVVGGSGAGAIYDANSAAATTGQVFAIPTTAGVTVLNFPVSNGIVVAPGTGQTISVSYS